MQVLNDSCLAGVSELTDILAATDSVGGLRYMSVSSAYLLIKVSVVELVAEHAEELDGIRSAII